MTRILRDVLASSLVALVLAAAISIMWYAMMTKARADGSLMPPPPPAYELPPPGAGVLPYTLPYRQGPPTRGCLMTAIQLGYQTGNRYVANAAVAACKAYAPVQYPSKYPPAMPLGGYPQ